MEELLQHLRGHFDKVAFGCDAAHARPLLVAAENGMHQVAELVEEGDDVAVLHQSRIVWVLPPGKLQISAASGSWRPSMPGISGAALNHLSFAIAGMHIQVEVAA